MSAPRLDSPWVLASAALALFVLLWARRGPATRAWWSGTLELAREVARAPRAAHGARRLPPAAVAAAAAALVAGGLALAEPRADAAARARTWTVVVDASPSMFLPWAPSGARPAADAPTRLERALTLLGPELAARRAAGERTLWLRTLDGGTERAEGSDLPQPWRSAPEAPSEPPDWDALDAPGTLWLSDDAQGVEPRSARACLSGGSAIPGPVAALGRERVAGSPAALARESGPAPAPRLALEGLEAQGSLGRLVEAWCQARGVERVRGPADLVLALASPLEPALVPARAGRDGWTWELAGERGTPAGRPWLACERGVLVAWRPGRIELAGAGLAEPEGDPAAFASSWSELLDRACLPPADVVATSERGAAGEPRVLGPGATPRVDGPARDTGAAVLASLAALLGAAALALSARD